MTDEQGAAPEQAPAGAVNIAAAPTGAVYFDGRSSRRHAVTLSLGDRLDIRADDRSLAAWPYADIRRADSPSGLLRLTCTGAPALARLEIRDQTLADDLAARCPRLEDGPAGRRGGVIAIIGWSLAAVVSVVLVVIYGMPLVADRVAAVIPPSMERRLGDATAGQMRMVFGGSDCSNPAGQAAFTKLVGAIRAAAGQGLAVESTVLSSSVPNAFALPGGRVFLLDGLLAKANNADEIAGVLAHELGHLEHHDSTRNLIRDGSTSFLIGLLFGDVSGSGVLVFASRSVVSAAYSREVEQNADTFSIDVMHRLGRSPKAMGELLFRVTGNEGDSGLSILASHPLTENRLARMTREDRPLTGPPLLTDEEWTALKEICAKPKT